MTEQIGKVTLDYTFYNGQDQYSDGDIENDLLQLIMEEPDVEKILAEDDRWPVLYHFSPVRQNILEWYPFKKDASVLEIGRMWSYQWSTLQKCKACDKCRSF